jgi:proline dehydrogenase
MNLSRSLFLSLSESRKLRSIAEHSRLAQKVSRRFVAGTTLEQAVEVCRRANQAGLSVTLDALGENVASAAQAEAAGELYHAMLERIAGLGLDANVSLKLTQMGMDLGGGVAEAIVAGLGRHAARLGNFVRVDMEGSRYTQATLELVRRLHRDPAIGASIGVVVQAYLYRTGKDVADLLAEGIRLRLCKGAYDEPAAVAFPAKADVDASYLRLMKVLLTSGIFHGLATHDERILAAAKSFVAEHGIDRAGFEFQMLYGIRRDLQEALVREGYRVRVYVPFGGEWYPYFMRRLAERPANALFVARNLFR